MSEEIAHRIRRSQRARARGDLEAAWGHLEDAHVLSQPWPWPHVRVHASMLGLGVRTRSGPEVRGQIPRLLAAGPASAAGRYPVGNSGRADVSAFAAAPVSPELAALLADATSAEPEQSGVLDAAGVRRLYDRVAPFYDLASKPYRWVGADRLVQQAIDELWVSSGDTVVDLGTGTGRNLIRLATSVGPAGRVIGVDVSPEMLRRARSKIAERGLHNVELVEADMATYRPPAETNAVLSTYAVEMLPTYDDLIGRLSDQIAPGGRIAVTGLRDPERWPPWLVRLGSAVNRLFGVSEDYSTHRPWDAVEAHTTDTIYDETLAGAIYLAAGTTTGAKS